MNGEATHSGQGTEAPTYLAERTIETAGLVKLYESGRRALDGLDLSAAAGQVYGLVGPNGAGKSTAIGCLLGLLRPTAGSASVMGLDLRGADPRDRARIGAVLQEPRLPDRWTGQDLMAERAAQIPSWDDDLASRLVQGFDLGRDLDAPTGTLSGGRRRLLSLLLALAGRPEVLILDEPAANLDPIARRGFLDALVHSLSEDRPPTVLLSSHLLADLERLADRVGIMDRGRMRMEGDIDQLKDRFQRAQWIFEDDPPASIQLPVRTHDLRREGRVISAVVELGSAAERAALHAVPGARLDLFPLNLEDLFVAVLGSDLPPSGSDVDRSPTLGSKPHDASA